MSTHPFRIKVRGTFLDLTPAQRAELLATAAEHDPLAASSTEQGCMSHEVAARPFFVFRVADAGDSEDDLPAAVARAEARASAWLDARGLAYRFTATVAEDLAVAPLAGRQRRERARG